MKAKQSLVARFGVEDGWRRYKELLGLPPTAQIRYATLAGQGEYGRRHGTRFVETFAGGAPFRVEGLPVLDGATSSCDPLACSFDTSRTSRGCLRPGGLGSHRDRPPRPARLRGRRAGHVRLRVRHRPVVLLGQPSLGLGGYCRRRPGVPPDRRGLHAAGAAARRHSATS